MEAMESCLGRKVKHDVVNARGLTLIPAGSLLNEEHLALLANHDVDPSSIHFATEEEESCEAAFRQATDASKELFDSVRLSRKVPLIEFRKEILPVVQSLSDHANVFQLFQAVKATDEYTYQHNIGVGVLSTLIGKWLGLPEAELSTLSLAATLHDIGKVRIPADLLNKPGKLTAEEYELVKKHTIFGYDILKHTVGLSPRVCLVALQHHERNDGKGYPFGLKQDKLDLFSRIVAVADIFHAMSSVRPYRGPMPFHEIVDQMRKGLFGELDPHIVSVFLNNIMKKMIGEEVVLTDGRIGEVVYLNPHSAETPMVKVGDEFLDLSKHSKLRIQSISI